MERKKAAEQGPEAVTLRNRPKAIFSETLYVSCKGIRPNISVQPYKYFRTPVLLYSRKFTSGSTLHCKEIGFF